VCFRDFDEAATAVAAAERFDGHVAAVRRTTA
jgi:hypothetical protein